MIQKKKKTYDQEIRGCLLLMPFLRTSLSHACSYRIACRPTTIPLHVKLNT